MGRSGCGPKYRHSRPAEVYPFYSAGKPSFLAKGSLTGAFYIGLMRFKIIKKHYGYVLVNETLNTHAHLPNYQGFKILLNLIKHNVDIKDKYLRNARDRLLKGVDDI